MRLGRSFLGATVALSAVVWSYGCSSAETDTGGVGGSTSATSSTATGTATGTATNTATATSSTGSGMMPIECKQTYTSVPKGDCDLLQQDCPAGKVCVVADMGGKPVSNCVDDLGGLKDKGAPCSTNSECKGGMICVDSLCSPVCCPGTNEPCGGGTCDVNLSFDNNPAVYAMACSYLPICTLFAGDCKGGTECHISDAGACLAVCDAPAASHVDEGGKCKYRNDCGESQFCNNNQPDDGVCRFFCDTTMPNAAEGKGGCPMGRTCKPAGGTGCTNLGICLPN